MVPVLPQREELKVRGPAGRPLATTESRSLVLQGSLG